MLGRVAVAISTLFLAVTVFPQCNLTQVASIPFRASYLDIFIDGNDLWAATSYGISLYDHSVDPPVLVASLPLPGVTRTVRATNGLVYAGSGSTLFVLRKNGKSLQLVRGIDAGATINDLLLTTLDLYVATAGGLTQWDLLDPTTPSKTSAVFTTSSANVRSLALNGSILFAADGDSTVESFNISIPSTPNAAGTISTLPFSVAVNVAAGRLYISDGLQTEVFTNIDGGGGGALKVASDSFGAVAVAPITTSTGTAVFAAGADRQIRAFDLTTPGTPVELSRVQLQPSGGNVNRIGRLAIAPNRLYVAGGDLGLLTYDTTSFTNPFPLRSYTTPGAATSVVSLGTTVYISRGTTGIIEFSQSSNGALTQQRAWDSSSDVVRDAANGFLLSSSGATASLWFLSSTTPTLVSALTLRAPIASAVLVGTTGYFVLTEAAGNTFWSADLGPLNPVAQQITLTGLKPSFVARSGSAIALAELRTDGTTGFAYYASPDFTKTPATGSVNGLSTGGIALSGSMAAASTFSGVSVVDFGSGTTTLLPQSNGGIARSLSFAGTTLVEATDTSLLLWNTQTRTLTKQFLLPAAPVAVHVGPDSAIADVATEDGITSVQLGAATRMPSLLFATNGNGYYKKLVAGSQRLYLFDGRNVDVFTNTMQSTGGIRTPLMTDVAATDNGAFTIQNNLTVTSYGREGNTLATSTINDTSDLPPSIVSAGGAAWASIFKNCQISGCEGKTIVFDPKSAFAQTSTMTGAVRDIFVSGSRAYVLTELPNEVRVVDISDPAHPSVLVSRASEGTQAPRAIAYANGTVYVLGDMLYSYSPTDLSSSGTQLGSYVTDPTSGVTFVDQHLRADGSCVALTGRQFSPQFLTGTPSIASPAAGRFVATQPGTFYFLTDYSVEIWSAKPLPPAPRRHAAR